MMLWSIENPYTGSGGIITELNFTTGQVYHTDPEGVRELSMLDVKDWVKRLQQLGIAVPVDEDLHMDVGL